MTWVEASTGRAIDTPADKVVNQIVEGEGKAVSNYDSVENGDKIIECAVKHFGRVDIVINNAG